MKKILHSAATAPASHLEGPQYSNPNHLLAFYETIPGLAKRLGVSPRTVQNWTAIGRIPSLRIGRLTRFDAAKVDAALAEFGVRSKRGVL